MHHTKDVFKALSTMFRPNDSIFGLGKGKYVISVRKKAQKDQQIHFRKKVEKTFWYGNLFIF